MKYLQGSGKAYLLPGASQAHPPAAAAWLVRARRLLQEMVTPALSIPISAKVFITRLKESDMRIPKFMIASTVCLAVVGGTALVYAQSPDTKPDNPSVPPQTAPQADPSPSPMGSGGLSAPSQQQTPNSMGTTPDNSAHPNTNTMDNSPSNPSSPSSATPSSERPARADRN